MWLDLDYQIKAQRALRERRGDCRFVLASSGTHDWDLDYRGQFVVANNTAWLRSLEERVVREAAAGGAEGADALIGGDAGARSGGAARADSHSGPMSHARNASSAQLQIRYYTRSMWILPGRRSRTRAIY